MYRGNVEAGALDWVGTGYTNSFYDPYSKPARDIYWRQVNEKLNVLGIDAWWMDATEPDLHSNLDIDSIKARMGPTAMGPAEQFFNSYPLVHTGGVYEGARAAQSRQARVHPHALGLRAASSAMPRRCGAATSFRAGTISTTRSPRA